MRTRLRDLDELIISCRSKSSKEYIQEAIACYEAGAFRASIISTWTSVFFDIVEKCQELALSGDAAAVALVDRFERAEANGDISALLKFEREMLQLARQDIELFSEIEHSDLRRIQEDRHRCAHPTRNLKGERFVPSAELARAHIVSAVDILLSQPASQGKAALDGILGQINSRLFPTDVEKAKDALAQTGLVKPRQSLVRNLLVVLLKSCLQAERNQLFSARVTAIEAILSLHRAATLEVFDNDLAKIVRAVPDELMSRIVWLMLRVEGAIPYFPEDQLDRMRKHVRTAAGEQLFDVEIALGLPAIKSAANERISWMTLEEMKASIILEIVPEFRSRLLELFAASDSFEEANAISEEIEKYYGDFSEVEKRTILDIGKANEQVKHSFGYKRIRAMIVAQLDQLQSQ